VLKLLACLVSSQAHDRGLHPKVTINCAGYKALTSMEEYMELMDGSLPGWKITNRYQSLSRRFFELYKTFFEYSLDAM